MNDDEKRPVTMAVAQLKQQAIAVAGELKAAAGPGREAIAGTGGGSHHRALPEQLRSRFIDVRAALFQRGLYDPVLVRFDTATVPQASTQEIAEQLEAISQSL